MTLPIGLTVAQTLRGDVDRASRGTKRMKLRSLMAKFGYIKRSDMNTAEITEVLYEAGVSVNPPIVRFGDSWNLSPEDWIYLSTRETPVESVDLSPPLPPTWQADGWFDRIAQLELRTEKEVEIKFIVPLLLRLGYDDDDRFDGMPVPAAHGSRDTTLVIDFAVFNAAMESLRNQPLMTVEAKRENRLVKEKELLSAHNQAKSYCLWTQCDYFMVTDSRTIQAFHISRGRLNGLDPIFACVRHELRGQFPKLHALVSKEVLSKHYLAKLGSVEEAV